MGQYREVGTTRTILAKRIRAFKRDVKAGRCLLANRAFRDDIADSPFLGKATRTRLAALNINCWPAPSERRRRRRRR